MNAYQWGLKVNPTRTSARLSVSVGRCSWDRLGRFCRTRIWHVRGELRTTPQLHLAVAMSHVWKLPSAMSLSPTFDNAPSSRAMGKQKPRPGPILTFASSACMHVLVIGITMTVFRRNIDYSDRWQTISPAWHSKKNIAFWGAVFTGAARGSRPFARPGAATCAFLSQSVVWGIPCQRVIIRRTLDIARRYAHR